MKLSLLVTLAASLAAAAPASAGAPTPVLQADAAKEAEFKKRNDEAGTDVAKLMDLAKWCDENGLRDQRRATLERVVELQPDHEEARKALRHHFYDGKWFKSYVELSTYKREEEKRMAEKGLVRVGDAWVPAADANYLKLGWEKNEAGEWVSKSELARAKRDAEMLAKGWRQQTDLVWVSPEEAKNWEENKWKCGDKWLTLEEANAYHAKLDQWWTIPSQRFLLLTTVEHETALAAANEADRIYGDMKRLFPFEPRGKPEVVILNSIAQYNTFSGGDQTRPLTATGGQSSCHYAHFAELRVDPGPPVEYKGCGVGYWQTNDPNIAPYGKHSVRHAAALSYVEAIDPSWSAVASMFSGGDFSPESFYAEKRIPRWLRYGAASYVERYYQDAYANDPWWTRKWALSNLLRQGPISPFETIFALRLDPADGTGRAISEAGLVVSFLLDGGCTPVVLAHRKWRAMLSRGENVKEAQAELQKALLDNREAFDAYVMMISS